MKGRRPSQKRRSEVRGNRGCATALGCSELIGTPACHSLVRRMAGVGLAGGAEMWFWRLCAASGLHDDGGGRCWNAMDITYRGDSDEWDILCWIPRYEHVWSAQWSQPPLWTCKEDASGTVRGLRQIRCRCKRGPEWRTAHDQRTAKLAVVVSLRSSLCVQPTLTPVA